MFRIIGHKITKIFLIVAVALASCAIFAAPAHALNLEPRYQFDGVLSFGSLRFNFDDNNLLLGLFDGSTFSIVGDNIVDTEGRAWDLELDYGTVQQHGNNANVNHPPNNDLDGLTALGNYELSRNTWWKRHGNTDVTAGTLLPIFSRGGFAANIHGLLGDRIKFSTWLTLFDQNGQRIAFGDPKFFGSTTQAEPDPIPEPMSLSLLGLGLLGGAAVRNRTKNASPKPSFYDGLEGEGHCGHLLTSGEGRIGMRSVFHQHQE